MLRLLYLFGDLVASTSVVCRSLVAFEIVGWFAVVVFLSIVFSRMVVNFSSFLHAQHAGPKEIISSLVVLS